MNLAGIALVLLTSSVFAAQKSYDLRLDINHNGKKFASPSTVIKEGETITLIESQGKEEKFIRIETEKDNVDGIKMKMAIGRIENDGSRTILANPEILIEENHRAKMMVGEESGEELSVSVLATPKKD